MDERIVNVLNEMAEYLSISQMKKLQEIILKNFSEGEIEKQNISNQDYLKLFLSSKRIEGCSGRTIKYYQSTINHFLTQIISIKSGDFANIRLNHRELTTESVGGIVINMKICDIKANHTLPFEIDDVKLIRLFSFYLHSAPTIESETAKKVDGHRLLDNWTNFISQLPQDRIKFYSNSFSTDKLKKVLKNMA